MTFKRFTILAMLFISFSAFSQNDYKAASEGWLVNIDEAYVQSQQTGKPILANFTGSDWCGWCKKLVRDVFSKPDFKKWADKNVVLLELDFPRSFKLPEDIQQQNASLQQAFGVRGYPTIWVFYLNKDAAQNNFNIEALGKTGYLSSVAEFTGGVEQMIEQYKSQK